MSDKDHANLKIISIVLLTIGFILIGFGLTGRAVGDYTLNDYCSSDKTCAIGKICCITQTGSGICYEKNVCDNLKNNMNQVYKEIPMKKDFSFYMNIGLFVLGVAIIMMIIIYFIEKKENKKSLKKKN